MIWRNGMRKYLRILTIRGSPFLGASKSQWKGSFWDSIDWEEGREKYFCCWSGQNHTHIGDFLETKILSLCLNEWDKCTIFFHKEWLILKIVTWSYFILSKVFFWKIHKLRIILSNSMIGFYHSNTLGDLRLMGWLSIRIIIQLLFGMRECLKRMGCLIW